MKFQSEGRIDDVFGLMMYQYGWHKLLNIRLFGRIWTIVMFAEAQPGHFPVEAQMRSYKKFSDNMTEIMDKVEKELADLLDKHPDVPATELFRPDNICIEENGNMVLELEYRYCDWEKDGGVGVTLVSAEERCSNEECATESTLSPINR